MNWRILATVFATTFLAEMGDKTQLAVISFTSSSRSPLAVFLGGSLALVLTTALGVLFGAGIARVVPTRVLHLVAALAFVAIGLAMLYKVARP
ncbi:MAG: TMEM165/GDT1 family protein [candidate division WOR-3 bacterium]